MHKITSTIYKKILKVIKNQRRFIKAKIMALSNRRSNSNGDYLTTTSRGSNKCSVNRNVELTTPLVLKENLR